MGHKVYFKIQTGGGSDGYEAFEREVDFLPRVGERVLLRGPEFGDEKEYTAWKEGDLVVGVAAFQVFGIDHGDGSPEVFLSIEPSEWIADLWCACTKKERESFGSVTKDDGRVVCDNCGRKQR